MKKQTTILKYLFLPRNKDQVEASLAMNVDRIYLGSDLYEEYKGNSKVYLRLERVNSTYPCTTSNILATDWEL